MLVILHGSAPPNAVPPSAPPQPLQRRAHARLRNQVPASGLTRGSCCPLAFDLQHHSWLDRLL